MSSAETYKRFARYYDLYVGDFSADLPLYRALCAPEHKILEIGCGTGRVLRALLDKGCRVTGMDTSNEMLGVAASKLRAYISQGSLLLGNHDLRLAPLEEQYNRILVTFFTFNYLLTQSDQRLFLRNVSKSLAAGGVVGLDLFYPEPLAHPGSSGQWFETVLEAEGQRVTLRQNRSMQGDIEERLQIYAEGTHQEEIVTRRRYVSETQAAAGHLSSVRHERPPEKRD